MSKLKTDKYRSTRGGHSRILIISCLPCGTEVARYQKDGPGSLKRMYFDRIHEPEELTGLENDTIKNAPTLACPKCQHTIGHPYIYKKEKRKAFRMIQDAFKKKIMKASK